MDEILEISKNIRRAILMQFLNALIPILVIDGDITIEFKLLQSVKKFDGMSVIILFLVKYIVFNEFLTDK